MSYESYQACADFLKSKISVAPRIGIILGSGLGGLVKEVDITEKISYTDIPGFPVSTVEGHSGYLIFGNLGGKEVMVMQGRFHYYEGYDMDKVTFPVRVMKFLGIETLLVSNAAGGMHPDFEVGDLMLIRDHINLQPEHPLRGKNDTRLGVRFPDMSQAYDAELMDSVLQIARSQNIKLHTGVYVGVQGPTFETPAEYKMFRILGGDAVGMSTVPEIIVARHMNMRCFAISVITDLGVEGKIVEISHEDVVKAAHEAEKVMTGLFKELIQTML
ncbi:MAG: purine-nucleoside phosphorylase [Flavobacteriales bacterium]|nr:purine-nucleoside phosphorylase [Flavobacteriales bacterium]